MPVQTPIPGYIIYSREMSVDDAEIHLFGICRPWISFIRTWTGHYQVLNGRANNLFSGFAHSLRSLREPLLEKR
jgi:hypothetical protein